MLLNVQTFKHFDLKWHNYERIHWQLLDGQAEPQLDVALREAAGKMFTAMGGVSYARCDFRVDQQGTVPVDSTQSLLPSHQRRTECGWTKQGKLGNFSGCL